MNIDNLFRIFVSSTSVDLKDYHEAAEQAINELGQKYDGMKYMGATDENASTASLAMVEKCDLFVGLYAWRYGTIPKGAEFSITEQEYRHAQKTGKPCLCYLVEDEYPWVPTYIDSGVAKKKLIAFKSSIEDDHVRDTFTTPEDFKHKLYRDISNWLSQDKPELKHSAPQPGENPETAYRSTIVNKYSTLTMLGFKRTFDMSGIYIPLTMHRDAESKSACRPEDMKLKTLGRSLTADELITTPANVAVVLGEPGMGKTTMLHYLALLEANKEDGLLPVFIKLSDFCKTNQPWRIMSRVKPCEILLKQR